MSVSSLAGLQECARRGGNYAAELVSQVATTAAGAIIENQPYSGTVTIEANDWTTDNTTDYPAYYDITLNGVTTDHRADVIFPLSSLTKAEAVGVSAFTETLANKIRIRAKAIPTEDLTAQIWVTKRREIQNAGNDE